MPVPETTDVGTLIKFFKKEHPEWPHKRVVAAALNSARSAGAKIPKKGKTLYRKKKRRT